MGMLSWLKEKFIGWLREEDHSSVAPLCDFDRLARALRPADVILVEGNTRLSHFIKTITQSQWTHSALYVGRLCEIGDAVLRQQIQRHYQESQAVPLNLAQPLNPDEPLIIEGLIGQGIIIEPLSKYRGVNMRVCQPHGLSSDDASRVLRFAARHLGVQYDIRQLFDLARWMSPHVWLPRRLGSSLFDINTRLSERTICSTLIAAAFDSVRFPVMPVVHRRDDGTLRFYQRNPRLCTPRDFDYSPYFDSVKFPVGAMEGIGAYRHLPWDTRGGAWNDGRECSVPDATRDSILPYYMKDDDISRHAFNWRQVRTLQRGASRRIKKHKVVAGMARE